MKSASCLFSELNIISTDKPPYSREFYREEEHEFLFPSPVDVAFQNGGHSLRKELAPIGANIFL